MTGVGDQPDQHAGVGRVTQTVTRIGDREGGFTPTGGGSCGKEAHGFFDCSRDVGELVEQKRILGNPSRSGLSRVRTQDFVKLGTHMGEHVRVNGENVQDVADGAAGGVVA